MQSQILDDISTLNSSIISSAKFNRTITVIRNSDQQSPDSIGFGENILPFVSRQGASSNKDVEIFYALTDQNTKNVEELKLKEIDYLSDEGWIVSLPLDCRSLKLALRFF